MLGPGFPILVPDTASESLEEMFSEMSLPAFLGMMQLNERKYGRGWMEKFIQRRYFGDDTPGPWRPLVEQGAKEREYREEMRKERERMESNRPWWSWLEDYGRARAK